MEIGRRELLKWALAAGAAAKLAGCARLLQQSSTGDGRGGLPKRPLGRTGQAVTIAGVGLPYLAADRSEAESRAIIEAALEEGINFFDTAGNYGDSEQRLGQALAGARDRVFITTKLESAEAKAAERCLAASLKRLRSDHVDLLLVHGVGLPGWRRDTKTMLAKGGVLEFLRKAKARGLTRFIGISIHPPHRYALELLDASDEWDVVMPFVNYVSRAKNNAEGRIVRRAHRDNVGVAAMKVFGAGHFADDYDRGFRYALSVPGVACAVIGVRSVEQVRRAADAARRFRPLTDAEMTETIRRGIEIARSQPRKTALFQRHAERDFGSTQHV